MGVSGDEMSRMVDAQYNTFCKGEGQFRAHGRDVSTWEHIKWCHQGHPNDELVWRFHGGFRIRLVVVNLPVRVDAGPEAVVAEAETNTILPEQPAAHMYMRRPVGFPCRRRPRPFNLCSMTGRIRLKPRRQPKSPGGHRQAESNKNQTAAKVAGPSIVAAGNEGASAHFRSDHYCSPHPHITSVSGNHVVEQMPPAESADPNPIKTKLANMLSQTHSGMQTQIGHIRADMQLQLNAAAQKSVQAHAVETVQREV